jgi:hypothetical protein
MLLRSFLKPDGNARLIWRGRLKGKEAVIPPNGAAYLFSASSFFL